MHLPARANTRCFADISRCHSFAPMYGTFVAFHLFSRFYGFVEHLAGARQRYRERRAVLHIRFIADLGFGFQHGHPRAGFACRFDGECRKRAYACALPVMRSGSSFMLVASARLRLAA